MDIIRHISDNTIAHIYLFGVMMILVISIIQTATVISPEHYSVYGWLNLFGILLIIGSICIYHIKRNIQ